MLDKSTWYDEFESVTLPHPRTAARNAEKRYRETVGKPKRAAWKVSDSGRASAGRRRDTLWQERPFVAWDGEGVTRDSGAHDYILFANSRGERISHANGLGTVALFEFILSRANKADINVIYGAGYDWNMWLGDLDMMTLAKLYKEGSCVWGEYWIKWRPGKVFHVGRRKSKESAMFYDVISFFQCAFVKACDEYLGDGFQHRDMIVQNKMLRSGFRPDDLAEIQTYNDAELVNLVALMNELRARLYKVGLKPSRWDGPGAIAVALFRRENIKDHLMQAPRAVGPAIRHAYFGGRFEVIRFGHVNRQCYEYDVNSAYPWALQDVPSLAGGTWEHAYGDDGTEQDFALYHVMYSSESDPSFPQPLPFRHDDGTVSFPREVTGWYWGPEYATAREYVKLYGGRLAVIEVWTFTPATDAKPFGFVPALYAERRALKAAKDGAHVGIKLGLNSMYGKTAQQVGWKETKDGLRLPPYHQLDWAGYVTSRCRAAVLRAVLKDLDAVIAFETDAVFTSRKLRVTEGDGLGEWEYTRFDSMTYVQSGTYFATKDGEVVDKTRGVDRGQLTRDKVITAMEAEADHVRASLTRFYGLGIALAQDWRKWRRWITSEKNVSLAPDGKRQHYGCEHDKGRFRLGVWHNTIPRRVTPGTHSTEFPIEWETPTEAGKALAELREGHYEGHRYDD